MKLELILLLIPHVHGDGLIIEWRTLNISKTQYMPRGTASNFSEMEIVFGAIAFLNTHVLSARVKIMRPISVEKI